jgi:glutathione S-transferase
MPRGCEYPLRLGDGVAAPGEDCSGVVLSLHGATALVLWESGEVLTYLAEDVVPLAGARAGTRGARGLALRCLSSLATVVDGAQEEAGRRS